MTEVGPADRSRLLQLKRAECSSIVTSRKRKLRELYAIATAPDGIPNFDFRDPDAPPTAPAELRFLLESDILQGRKLNELNIPPRPKIRSDTLSRLLPDSGVSPGEKETHVALRKGLEQGSKSPLPGGTGSQEAIDPTSRTSDVHLPQLDLPAAGTPTSVSKPSHSIGPNVVVNGIGDSTQAAQVPLDAQDYLHSGSSSRLPTVKEDVRSASEARPAAAQAVAQPAIRSNGDRGEGDLAGKALVSKAVNGRPVTPTKTRDQGQASADVVPTINKQSGSSLLPAHLQAGEPPKATDLLSSPGSTAHSATSPVVHDSSTDTSPDNEALQFSGRDDDQSSQPEGADSQPVPEKPRQILRPEATATAHNLASPTEPYSGTSSGVEAQLLEESAAAGLSRRDGRTESRPASSTDSIQGGLPTKRPASNANESVGGGQTKTGESDILPSDGDFATSEAARSSAATSQIREPVSASSTAADKARLPEPDPSPSGSVPNVSNLESQKRAQVSAAEGRASTSRIPSAAPATATAKVVAELPPPTLEDERAALTAGDPHPTPARVSQHLDATRTSGSPGRSLSASQVHFADTRRRSQDSRRTPTVVFGKQTRRSDERSLVPTRAGPGQLPTDDYYTPLFIQGFTQSSKWMKTIDVLLHQAHKTVSTSDQYVSILDNQACRILRRVYHLQQHDKWSLRQPSRCAEPTRPPSHWDVLLQEMKWMRTDFREERKWKRAVAQNLAYACAEWVASTPERRKALQVNATPPPKASGGRADASVASATHGPDDPMPDLIYSGDLSSPMEHDEPTEALVDTIAPSAIFALQDDDVVFGLERSPMSDKLLEELPVYGSPLKVPKFDLTGPDYDPDARWKRPAVPLSKYVEGQMVLAPKLLPKKRSRYQYEAEDDEEENQEVIFGGEHNRGSRLEPENVNVALFNPEMKPIRDRLHAGHQFRPPTEYPMPLQNFYESRTASQWTWAEDDELKALVREYSYNWSLISNMVSTKSSFASGAERRTPWECFERWVNLEGLPNDMSKTQYFKTYHNRIEAAQRVIHQQNQNAQQQVGPNGAVTPVPRRRPTTTVRVERRRNQKHLALIDAMRKLAKKRETTLQKQQHAANLAASRKANEVQQQQRGPTKTPRDYSLMRWERDQQLAEKMAQYAQRQQEAQRRAMQARAQAQAPPLAAANSAGQVPQNAAQLAAAANSLAGANRLNVPGQLAVPASARPARIPMQAPAAAMAGVQAQMAGGLVPPIPMNGIPQAQLQALQAQHRVPMPTQPPHINLLMQARQIQDQQRQAVQLQQQQHQQAQHPQHQQTPLPSQQQNQQAQQGQQVSQVPPMPQVPQVTQVPPQANGGVQTSPTGMRNAVNGISQQTYMANAQAMMTVPFNGINGAGIATSPGAAGMGMPPVPAGSPRGPVIPAQKFPAFAAQLQELEAQYRAKNPNLTPEQARHLATEHFARVMVQRQQQMNQSAMNAAAGGPAQQAIPNGISATTSPHQYAQLLRAQQQAQAAAAAAQQAGQHQRNPSGSAAPVASK